MKIFFQGLAVVTAIFMLLGTGKAAVQDKYDLPEPYLGWEKAYLQEFPQLQGVMEVMVNITAKQLKDPDGDILHNRVCAALAYRMAGHLTKEIQKLTIATDLLTTLAKKKRKQS